MKPFVLSDGSKINSFGFRVRTSGINFSRFDANPVMLAEHKNSIDSVIGKWLNRNIDGVKLVAEPDFDMEDDISKKIAGKVERGFVNGASIGIQFDWDMLQKQEDGEWELIECELLEASICAIPSNASALRLYAATDGHLMDEQEIKLSLAARSADGAVINKHKPKEREMKKVVLSLAVLMALDLQKENTADGVDAAAIESAVLKLQSERDTANSQLSAQKTAYEALKEQVDAQAKLHVDKLIDEAIKSGKIDATKKEDWTKLAMSNLAMAESTLASIPAKKTLSTEVNNPDAGGDVKSMDDFQKMPVDKQLAWRAANPDAYKSICG